jgi:hypothetical protein
LYAAAFLSGAGLCESQALAPPIYVFPLLIALADLKTGRNLFLAESLVLCAWLAAQNQLADVGWQVIAMGRSIEALTTASTIAWLSCWWRTGRPFGDFRCSAKCVALFTAGLLLCFLNPVLSLTNPPVNWGYPRTDEGFFHVLSRGQFDSFAPPPNISQFTARLFDYGRDLLFNIGPMYLVAAALTLPLCRRAPSIVRKFIAGMWAMWLIITLITVSALNLEQRDLSNARPLFTPAIAPLMLLAGYGITLAFQIQQPSSLPINIPPMADPNDEHQ